MQHLKLRAGAGKNANFDINSAWVFMLVTQTEPREAKKFCYFCTQTHTHPFSLLQNFRELLENVKILIRVAASERAVNIMVMCAFAILLLSSWPFALFRAAIFFSVCWWVYKFLWSAKKKNSNNHWRVLRRFERETMVYFIRLCFFFSLSLFLSMLLWAYAENWEAVTLSCFRVNFTSFYTANMVSTNCHHAKQLYTMFSREKTMRGT